MLFVTPHQRPEKHTPEYVTCVRRKFCEFRFAEYIFATTASTETILPRKFIDRAREMGAKGNDKQLSQFLVCAFNTKHRSMGWRRRVIPHVGYTYEHAKAKTQTNALNPEKAA
ncbi:hypothetical protein AB4254_11760 [Vibrio breoganii]